MVLTARCPLPAARGRARGGAAALRLSQNARHWPRCSCCGWSIDRIADWLCSRWDLFAGCSSRARHCQTDSDQVSQAKDSTTHCRETRSQLGFRLAALALGRAWERSQASRRRADRAKAAQMGPEQLRRHQRRHQRRQCGQLQVRRCAPSSSAASAWRDCRELSGLTSSQAKTFTNCHCCCSGGPACGGTCWLPLAGWRTPPPPPESANSGPDVHAAWPASERSLRATRLMMQGRRRNSLTPSPRR